ncbi:hypothetical protein NQ117_09280 [Paenibacillus sp. SC116]|uniref:hypothetical protein n=1 Tax=Paenibacillus sp. SC116 TaxID=2968986 RepID=UPI00215AB63E|nr:hypothetical protein [Paenibacillus sp. SC116]MCR8843879.1 hypothetical protein [Paenibacillus sp. SC116]
MNDSDLTQIGAAFIDFEGSSAAEAAQYIESNLQTGNVVFTGIKPKYFPELHFMDAESTHYIIIEQFTNTQHTILNDVKNIVSKSYTADFVLQAIRDSNYPLFSLQTKHIALSTETIAEFRNRARQAILHNDDDSRLFDHILEMVRGLPQAPIGAAKEMFNSLGQVFIMLSGSRYVFSCYIELQPVPAYVVDLLRHCSDQAETIKNIIIKKDIQLKNTNHPLQLDQLIEKIEMLRDYELITLLALKKELANV